MRLDPPQLPRILGHLVVAGPACIPPVDRLHRPLMSQMGPPRRQFLLLVDLQPELLLDEPANAAHHSLGRLLAAYKDVAVSSPGESHPQALSEPDVNLSAHPAPIIQPLGESPFASE